jgi:hypothetical protein
LGSWKCPAAIPGQFSGRSEPQRVRARALRSAGSSIFQALKFLDRLPRTSAGSESVRHRSNNSSGSPAAA